MIVKRNIQKLMDEGVIQISQDRDMDNYVNLIVLIFKTHEQVVIQFDNSKRSER